MVKLPKYVIIHNNNEFFFCLIFQYFEYNSEKSKTLFGKILFVCE